MNNYDLSIVELHGRIVFHCAEWYASHYLLALLGDAEEKVALMSMCAFLCWKNRVLKSRNSRKHLCCWNKSSNESVYVFALRASLLQQNRKNFVCPHFRTSPKTNVSLHEKCFMKGTKTFFAPNWDPWVFSCRGTLGNNHIMLARIDSWR